MRRSEEARVSEEAVRRKGCKGGPRKLGMGYGEAEEPVWNAGESAAGREGAGRSEKAKVPEDGGLINQALIGLKPVNACVHTYTKSQTPSTRRRGPGWRIHGSVEDTKLSTNKQHTLSLSPWRCRSISENEMGVKAQRARVSE